MVQEQCMKQTKTNLRFLLALGNRKVVVLEDEQQLSVYSDASKSRESNRVNAERIGQAVTAR